MDEKNDKNIYEDKNINNVDDTINIKEEKENETVIENNEHEFSFTSELKKNLENKENKNIEENILKNNISNDNELIDALNINIIEQSISKNKGNKQNKENSKKEGEKKENISLRKLNKSLDIKRRYNIKSKNNDYFLDSDNDINNSKEVQTKKIKYNNPSHFIRKVIREEYYYIDENGKEKLFEVKQRLINEGNNKKKFFNLLILKKI